MKLCTWLGISLTAGMLCLSFGCTSGKTVNPSDYIINNPEDEPTESTVINDENSKRDDGEFIKNLPPRDNWTIIRGLKFPTVYFAYDQSRISIGELMKIEKVVDYMKKNPSIGVSVEGHCDERGSEEYNRGLGERRAISVKDYMIQLGIPENRLRTVSYGEERPAVTGKSRKSYRKNRRAELIPNKM